MVHTNSINFNYYSKAGRLMHDEKLIRRDRVEEAARLIREREAAALRVIRRAYWIGVLAGFIVGLSFGAVLWV